MKSKNFKFENELSRSAILLQINYKFIQKISIDLLRLFSRIHSKIILNNINQSHLLKSTYPLTNLVFQPFYFKFQSFE